MFEYFENPIDVLGVVEAICVREDGKVFEASKGGLTLQLEVDEDKAYGVVEVVLLECRDTDLGQAELSDSEQVFDSQLLLLKCRSAGAKHKTSTLLYILKHHFQALEVARVCQFDQILERLKAKARFLCVLNIKHVVCELDGHLLESLVEHLPLAQSLSCCEQVHNPTHHLERVVVELQQAYQEVFKFCLIFKDAAGNVFACI